ncbi:MAG: aldo/keto reductase [Calditrichaeota bacterium]|nr:MAG: aldo/keto reductase [Calditrichota bacterium]MBL1204585.1 aldo/keto reductase [Calditrichota bacterium]NOG44414.1 aldo/keto reductase [Calditrichota bacterium]
MLKSATPEATKLYSKKYETLNYEHLGQTNLSVSQAGFGGYRVHISVDEHRQALEYALTHGINLIDTSSNYANGGSEELIGAAFKNLSEEKKLKRDEIVIVSKVGYLQGQNFQLSQQLKQQGKPFPDLVEYGSGLEHCIHPDFLADQLTRSLNRLQMKTIDVYLLHNPEYYLLWAHKQGMDLEEARTEYYRRIEQAFMQLEIEVQNGRIQFYGISSNTFPIPSKHYDFTSLEKVWDIAESISKNHKFRVVQMPMNLFETGAATEPNLSDNQSPLKFAEIKKIAVLVNRPLNAFSGNHMKRLVTLETSVEFDQDALQEKFSQIVNMESDFVSNILPVLNADEDTQKKFSGYFSSGSYLSTNWQKLGPYWQWIESQALFLTDQISHAVQQVNDLPDKSKETIKWLDDYVELFNTLLGYLTLYLGEKISKENKIHFDKIKDINKVLNKCESLQELALSALLNSDGVTTTLVGMRRKEYVQDVLNILKQSKINLPKDFWINTNKQ